MNVFKVIEVTLPRETGVTEWLFSGEYEEWGDWIMLPAALNKNKPSRLAERFHCSEEVVNKLKEIEARDDYTEISFLAIEVTY